MTRIVVVVSDGVRAKYLGGGKVGRRSIRQRSGGMHNSAALFVHPISHLPILSCTYIQPRNQHLQYLSCRNQSTRPAHQPGEEGEGEASRAADWASISALEDAVVVADALRNGDSGLFWKARRKLKWTRKRGKSLNRSMRGDNWAQTRIVMLNPNRSWILEVCFRISRMVRSNW